MRLSRWVAAVISAAAVSACYGKFALTRKVYQFNGTISNDKFVKSIVAFVFIYFPVYALAGLADWVIFNVIEFWTGSNPIDTGRLPIKSGDATLSIERNKDVLRLTLERPNLARRHIELRRQDAQILARAYEDERLLEERTFVQGYAPAEALAAAELTPDRLDQ